MTRSSPLFKAYIALGLVSFFWGTTYLAIRIGVETMPPFLLAGLRQMSAGILLAGYFILRGFSFPKWADFKKILIPSILMITMGNGLVTWAEQYINSGLTAILCAMNPVWVLLLSLLFVETENLSRRVIAGVLIGFIGILVIFADNLKDFANLDYTLGILGILVANLSWAGGTIYISRNKPGINSVFSAGIQMFLAGLFLLILSFFFDTTSKESFTTEGVLALVYLIIFGSLVAYGAFLYALDHLSPTRVSIYAYINTVVAVMLGFLWLSEPLTTPILIGTAVTIYGIYLVNTGKNKPIK